MALSVVPAAFVAANAWVVAVVDTVATSKNFNQNAWTGASAGAPPTGATPGLQAGNPMVGFPTVAALPTLVAAGPDSAGNQDVGYIKLTLVPNAGDTVNASSPMQLLLSPNALVVTASSATG